MVIKIHKHKAIDNAFKLGEGSNLLTDRACAMLFALTPILQHYKGLYRNAGFTILLLVSIFFVLRSLINIFHNNVNSKCLIAIMPLVIYEIYTIFAHSISVNNTIYGMFMIAVFIAIAAGAVNSKTFFHTALVICKLATVCVVVQYLSYYLLHKHIQMIPVNMLLEGSDRWIRRAVVGISRAGELYRPSAFFLEPSHLYLYSFPVLCVILLSQKSDSNRIKDGIIVSLGMLLSTSGFSVAVVVMLWAVYFILFKNNKTADFNLLRLLSPRTIWIIVLIFAALIAAYFSVPIFRDTVSRIFDTDAGTSVAISGRVRLANEYIRNLHGKTLIFGASNRFEGFEFNMAGFHSTLYKWGIIGIVLTYWFYAQGLYKLKGEYFYMTIIIIITSFFSAHTHGTFYMMYYAMFLMNGIYVRSISSEQRELSMNYGVLMND